MWIEKTFLLSTDLQFLRYEKRQALKARFEIEQKLRRERKTEKKRLREKEERQKRMREKRPRTKEEKSKSRAMDELKARRGEGTVFHGGFYMQTKLNLYTYMYMYALIYMHTKEHNMAVGSAKLDNKLPSV